MDEEPQPKIVIFDSGDREGKAVYLDSANAPRSLRGRIVIEGEVVLITRRDGVFILPMRRLVQVEMWADDETGART